MIYQAGDGLQTVKGKAQLSLSYRLLLSIIKSMFFSV